MPLASEGQLKRTGNLGFGGPSSWLSILGAPLRYGGKSAASGTRHSTRRLNFNLNSRDPLHAQVHALQVVRLQTTSTIILFGYSVMHLFESLDASILVSLQQPRQQHYNNHLSRV